MDEFSAWMAYADLEPFGEERADLRAGLDWSLVASIDCDRKKFPKGIGIDKYPLLRMREQMERPPTQLTSQSLLHTMKGLAAAMSKRKPS